MPASQSSLRSNCPILPSWFASEAGRALLAEQFDAMDNLIPDQVYECGWQYGLTRKPLLAQLNIEYSVYCDCAIEADSVTNVVALPEALPLPENSVDLALLFHTLDYCHNPHRVLREVSQLMSPEGVIVLSGFHPFSLWGARQKLGSKEVPFDARFISRSQVQDWFALLGFQSLTGCMINYQFAQLNEHWRGKLAFMNKLGDRWWPTLGTVYILVVKKKVYSGLRAPQRQKVARWLPEMKPARAKIAQQTASEDKLSLTISA